MVKSNLNQLEVKLFAKAIEEIGFSKKIVHINVDACDVDDDNDIIPDAWELLYGLDPYYKSDAHEDPDGDGFTL